MFARVNPRTGQEMSDPRKTEEDSRRCQCGGTHKLAPNSRHNLRQRFRLGNRLVMKNRDRIATRITTPGSTSGHMACRGYALRSLACSRARALSGFALATVGKLSCSSSAASRCSSSLASSRRRTQHAAAARSAAATAPSPPRPFRQAPTSRSVQGWLDEAAAKPRCCRRTLHRGRCASLTQRESEPHGDRAAPAKFARAQECERS
jgi:hypothetical protein